MECHINTFKMKNAFILAEIQNQNDAFWKQIHVPMND